MGECKKNRRDCIPRYTIIEPFLRIHRPRKKKVDGEAAAPQPKKRKRADSRKESTETESATEV